MGAPADEMNNFQTVAIVKPSLGPAIARYDLAIQFHGDAIGFHAQRFNQRRKGKWGRLLAEIALFPVDVEFHFVGAAFPADERIVARWPLLGLMQKELPRRGPPFKIGLHDQGRVRQRRFLNLNLDLGCASGIGHSLGIERGRTGTGKAENQARTGGRRASLGDL